MDLCCSLQGCRLHVDTGRSYSCWQSGRHAHCAQDRSGNFRGTAGFLHLEIEPESLWCWQLCFNGYGMRIYSIQIENIADC